MSNWDFESSCSDSNDGVDYPILLWEDGGSLPSLGFFGRMIEGIIDFFSKS